MQGRPIRVNRPFRAGFIVAGFIVAGFIVAEFIVAEFIVAGNLTPGWFPGFFHHL